MKILFSNFGYGTGLNGSIKNYIYSAWMYIYTPVYIEQQVVEKFMYIIEDENPDIVCLVEITHRKILVNELKKQYPYYNITNKYHGSWLEKLPFLRNKYSGFFSKENTLFKKSSFPYFGKRLIYTLLPSKSVCVFLHLSLGKNTRDKQLKYLIKKYKNNPNLIIGGDLNIFKGENELNDIKNKLGLKILQNTASFPSCKPSKKLDVFLSNISNASTKTLSYDFSDHKAILITIP